MKMQFWRALGMAVAFALPGNNAFAADIYEPPVVYAPAPESKARIKIGVLTCSRAGGFGYIIGSAKDLSCTFSNYNGDGRSESYTGQIIKVGADIGYTAGGAMAWAVFAPSHEIPNGRLDGTYVGVSAEATAGLGLGANVLFGSFNRSINLVPLSVSGDIGLNVAGGLGAITLSSG